MAISENARERKKNALWVSSAVLLLVALAFISFNVEKLDLSGSAVKKVIIVGNDPLVCIKPPCPAKETVTCIFIGSSRKQECSSSKGSCMGVKLCSMKIEGKQGEQLKWGNTCNEKLAYTTIDGKNENIEFKCSATAASIKCTDSDMGRKIFAKGTAKDGIETKTDYCFLASTGADELREYYCDSTGVVSSYSVFCKCFDGACTK